MASIAERVSVALVEPLYPINVGYVARCMKNFGLTNLILVNPQCRVDDEAIRYAMHGRDVLERARIVDSLALLRSEYEVIVGTTGKHGKKPSAIRRWVTPEKLAKQVSEMRGKYLVVFGREDRGLTNEELAECDMVVTIPANPEYPILNLSHAAVIIFYEIYKHASAATPEELAPRRAECEALIKYATGLMELFGLPEHRIRKARILLRRIVYDRGLRYEDVRLLLGIIRRAYDYVKTATG